MFYVFTFKSNSDNFDGNKSIKFLETKGVEARPLIAGNISKHPAKKINEF